MKTLRFIAYLILLLSTIVEAKQSATTITGVTVETSNGTALQMVNANERNASFNASLHKAQLSGRIEQCSSLVDVPVGTAHGNHSFGGLCTQVSNGKKNAVMICDDEMIGHFKVEKINRKVPIQELINFTVTNCYGG